MLIKIELPDGARILKNDGNEIIMDLPMSCNQYQTAVSMFSVKGHTLEDFTNNCAISSAEILITPGGMLEPESDELTDDDSNADETDVD